MGEWISVDEALPLIGQNVLTVGPKGSMETIRYRGLSGTRTRRDKWEWKQNSVKTITHWMPLPEPPKEEK